MTKIDDKYLPLIPEQVATVKTQIEEIKRIIFRNTLEASLAKEQGNKALVAESEYNNSLLIEKIDVLEKEYTRLEKIKRQ